MGITIMIILGIVVFGLTDFFLINNYTIKDCKNHILSKNTVIAIIIGILMSLVSYFRYELSVEAIYTLVFFDILMVIAFTDIKDMKIPDRYNLAILLLGIALMFCTKDMPNYSRLIGFFALSVPFFILSVIIKDSFGGGDIKLLACAGVFLGWEQLMYSVFIAVIIGGVYGVWLLCVKKKGRNYKFAFGPFLCLGMLCAVINGAMVTAWFREYIYTFFELIRKAD